MNKKSKIWIAIIICLLLVVLFSIGSYKFIKWYNEKIQTEAKEMFNQAEQFRTQGQWKEAIDEYKVILDKYPKFYDIPEVEFKIANINRYQLLNISEAQNFYERVLKRKNKFSQHQRMAGTLIELALIYRAERKNKEAISLLEEALAKYPNRIDKKFVYFQLEMLYGEIGDRDKVKEMYLKRGEL